MEFKRVDCPKCDKYKKQGYTHCLSCWQDYPINKPDRKDSMHHKPNTGHYICKCAVKGDYAPDFRKNGKNYCNGCYEHNSFCELCFMIDNNAKVYNRTTYCTECYNYYANGIKAPGSYIEYFESLIPPKWNDFHHDDKVVQTVEEKKNVQAINHNELHYVKWYEY